MSEEQQKLWTILGAFGVVGIILSKMLPFWLICVLLAISVGVLYGGQKMISMSLRAKQAAAAAAFALGLACTMQLGVSHFTKTPLLPVQTAQAAVAPREDPNDPAVLAKRFQIYTMAGCALRGYDTSDTDYYGDAELAWTRDGDEITYSSTAHGIRIGTASAGGVSETHAFDRSEVACSDMKVVKNPVGQWERSSGSYGQCRRLSSDKIDVRIWRDKDGSYVDSSRTVVVPATAKRLSGCVFVQR